MVQNALDESYVKTLGQARMISPYVSFPPLKFCNNDGIACERDLAMVKFQRIESGTPLPIAPDTFISSSNMIILPLNHLKMTNIRFACSLSSLWMGRLG